MRDRLARRSRRGTAGLVWRVARQLEWTAHAAAGKAKRSEHQERSQDAKLETALHMDRLNPVHSPQRQATSETAYCFRADGYF